MACSLMGPMDAKGLLTFSIPPSTSMPSILRCLQPLCHHPGSALLHLVAASLLRLQRCTLIAQQQCHLSQRQNADRLHAKEVLRL